MKRSDLISAIIWMLLAIYISFESIQRLGINSIRNPGAGFFPLLTALIIASFALLLLFKSVFANTHLQVIWDRETNWKNLVLTVFALLSFAILLNITGYLLTTFLFILFLFLIIDPLKWYVATLGAAITTLISYLIFEIWLQSQLPEGIFITWLRRLSNN